jgi:hypothetical protein
MVVCIEYKPVAAGRHLFCPGGDPCMERKNVNV